MNAGQIIRKAKALENRLHRLQADIYDFSSALEDQGQKRFAEYATESGFELDVSHSKMKDIWQECEKAFGRKITPSSNK